jgi:hypothetical protein
MGAQWYSLLAPSVGFEGFEKNAYQTYYIFCLALHIRIDSKIVQILLQ